MTIKYSPYLILLAFLFGCSINFNNDLYKTLTTEEKTGIITNKNIEECSDYQLVETTPKQILECSKRYKNTIIYLYQPWCAPCVLELQQLIDFEKKVTNNKKSLKLIVVSYQYRPKIAETYKKFEYKSPILIIPNKPYGDKLIEKGDNYILEIRKVFKNEKISSGLIILNSKQELIYQNYKINNLDSINDILE